MLFCITVVPVIEEGGSQPPSAEKGVIRVNIGTTVYTINGFNIIITCNVNSGGIPVTISWFRNNELDQSKENSSSITVTDAMEGDVFTCKAENEVGFDRKNTVIKFTKNAFCVAK